MAAGDFRLTYCNIPFVTDDAQCFRVPGHSQARTHRVISNPWRTSWMKSTGYCRGRTWTTFTRP